MRVLLAFGLCLMLMNLFAGNRGLPAVWKSRREAQLIARDIGALRTENAALRGRAQALREDARTIELVARETLGLARPGEIVVMRRLRPSDSPTGSLARRFAGPLPPPLKLRRDLAEALRAKAGRSPGFARDTRSRRAPPKSR